MAAIAVLGFGALIAIFLVHRLDHKLASITREDLRMLAHQHLQALQAEAKGEHPRPSAETIARRWFLYAETYVRRHNYEVLDLTDDESTIVGDRVLRTAPAHHP